MKYTVLGFLIDQPMHGYALKRALSPALPPQQTVNDGILYPLLNRMEAEGLVRKRVERGRGGARPATCSIRRAEGRRAFDEWLAGSDDESDEVTYDFLLGHPFLTQVPVLQQAHAGRRCARSSRTSSRTARRSSRRSSRSARAWSDAKWTGTASRCSTSESHNRGRSSDG